ncbi:MAG: aromatic-ring-hydroxylating dioxygenase subunit beta [Alphaproteobacteria bacterium]|nr:aromatic-ring-hydroxylating dioxygenase subunit beta [Alphaproteobacteria bacterium]MCB9929806.1 aromatic-ring-hydroxylating dioxygenase subunit beta [Alphaproteobacteria bacterium]
MTITPELQQRVEDLLADYAQAIDDDNVEAWPDFFTDDALYLVTTLEAESRGYPMAIMRCQGIGQIRDRVTALRKANIFEPHHHCHILSRPRLTRAEDGSIRARSAMLIYRTMETGKQDCFAVGRYQDTLVEVDGALKLRERRAILDTRQVDVLLVYPL